MFFAFGSYVFSFECVFNCCFCVSNAVLAASCILLLNECFSNAIGIVAIPNALVTLLAISGMGGARLTNMMTTLLETFIISIMLMKSQ